uniref:Putative secreted peptide n=1 Tax=Anopheles braziliensis TaxID=58242 RepID=A0A2M3ZW43_9DIPT
MLRTDPKFTLVSFHFPLVVFFILFDGFSTLNAHSRHESAKCKRFVLNAESYPFTHCCPYVKKAKCLSTMGM